MNVVVVSGKHVYRQAGAVMAAVGKFVSSVR